MNKNMFLLLACCSVLTSPVLAQEQHQHRRPDDIKQYLEHLDSTERDHYQKPIQVMAALKLIPGMAWPISDQDRVTSHAALSKPSPKLAWSTPST